METAIVSVICIALIVIGGMTMSQNFLSSVDTHAMGFEQLGVRDEAILKTNVTPLTANLVDSSTLDVSLRNSGQTKLSSFSQWDVIVKYYNGTSYYVNWLPYTSGTPDNNQWTVRGIYLSAADQTPEVFEPGILNAGEEMIIRLELNPVVGRHTNNMVVISTPNGVSMSIAFVRN